MNKASVIGPHGNDLDVLMGALTDYAAQIWSNLTESIADRRIVHVPIPKRKREAKGRKTGHNGKN
jgi:hypothetical protein